NPVHARTVERIEEPARVAYERETIARDRPAGIRQVLAPMDVALAPLGVSQNLARHRMLHEEVFQPLAGPTAFRPLHAPLIEHDADAHVAALERNTPRPPAVAGKMVGGGRAKAVAGHRPMGKFL